LPRKLYTAIYTGLQPSLQLTNKTNRNPKEKLLNKRDSYLTIPKLYTSRKQHIWRTLHIKQLSVYAITFSYPSSFCATRLRYAGRIRTKRI